jgi:KUP system potassium uptake protein
MAALTISALGVVFGDIGTSPLYALKECVNPEHGFVQTRADLLGVLSIIFWSLMLIVTAKYLLLVMRADNRGEGGVFALLALLPERILSPDGVRIGAAALLILIGAALLYGDGVITPVISVLSAVEGLELATSALRPAVIPITCGILLGLFAIQRYGTRAVGRLFGPVMVLWFGTLAGLGAWHVAAHPEILGALSPHHAARFFAEHGWRGGLVLGSVVLAVTGAEALYADMGHFGLRPIRRAWSALTMPALVLAYFGQGALLLTDPAATENPFFAMVPRGPWTVALVLLAAAATVIASQALISGAFSLTRQAVQLGYFPRVEIRHTSPDAEGQIYVPAVNWAMAVGCLLLVVTLQESSRLAAAYGIAVTGTMTITSIAFYAVARHHWGWSRAAALPMLALLLALDLPFLAANLIKFPNGGYIPVGIGVVLLGIMLIWRTGHALVAQYHRRCPKLTEFLCALTPEMAIRVPGAAVFLTELESIAPATLLHHVKRNRALHEIVMLLTIKTEHVPTLAGERRWELHDESKGFCRVIARYGYMEQPDVAMLLQEIVAKREPAIRLEDVTFYLGRSTFLATERGSMGPLAEATYAFLERNARAADLYFRIPPALVIELGNRIDL